MLGNPVDYKELNSILKSNGSNVKLFEYDLGHLGLLFPEDKTSTEKIIEETVMGYLED